MVTNAWKTKLIEIRQVAKDRNLKLKKGGTFRLIVWYMEQPYGELVLRPDRLSIEKETVYGTFELTLPSGEKVYQCAPYLYCLQAFSFELRNEYISLITQNLEIHFYDDRERNRIRKARENLRECEPWLNEKALKNLPVYKNAIS